MRVGLTYESKSWFPFGPGDSPDANSEHLNNDEVDELVTGLRDAGFDVVPIGDATRLREGLPEWKSRCDIVFNRAVGYRGVERKSAAPAIMEAVGIPYVGSAPYSLTLTRHKYHAKLVVASAGVATPPSTVLYGGTPEQLDSVIYPAIVKPLGESSSIGIEHGKAIVADADAARQRAATLLAQYGQPVIVETFVPGLEVEVPLVLDPEPRVLCLAAIGANGVLPPPEHYLTSDDVYVDRYDFLDVPEWVDADRLRRDAIVCARALEIRDYGRIDFRISADGTPWFIEASTHPHVQRHSSFHFAAHKRGARYADMLSELVMAGARRYGLGN